MKKRFTISIIAAFLFIFLTGFFGCGGVDSSSSNNTETPTSNPLGLPEFKELPVDGSLPATTLRMGKTRTRNKSSNDTDSVVKGDIESYRVDFRDQSGNYLGSLKIPAPEFESGYETKVNLGAYRLYATTFGSKTGFSFYSQEVEVVLESEGIGTEVEFEFQLSGVLWVNCFIQNPSGEYLEWRQYELNLVDSNSTNLSFCSTSQDQSVASYDAKNNRINFKLQYTYEYENLSNDDYSQHNLYIATPQEWFEGVFNIQDIQYGLPVEIVVKEMGFLPGGNEEEGTGLQIGGSFPFENKEINVNLEDGNSITFPLNISGTVKGITGKLGIAVVADGGIVFYKTTLPENNEFKIFVSQPSSIEDGDVIGVVVYDLGSKEQVHVTDLTVIEEDEDEQEEDKLITISSPKKGEVVTEDFFWVIADIHIPGELFARVSVVDTENEEVFWEENMYIFAGRIITKVYLDELSYYTQEVMLKVHASRSGEEELVYFRLE